MAVESDDIALSVTTDATGRTLDLREKPVVTFCGWVKVDRDVVRLYTDPWFTEWLEISTGDVVHQVKGAERPHDEGRSTLWVAGDAGVKTCSRDTGEMIVAATASSVARADLPRRDLPPPSRR